MRVDLHIHTKYSKDCALEPADILRAAADKRLDAIAITDHGTIGGGVATKKLAEEEGIGINVIQGAEIRTDRGEIIGYGLHEEIAVRDFLGVVDAIRGQGGFVVAPHPFDSIRPYSIRLDEDVLRAIDGVEVFNSRCMLSAFNDRAMKFALDHGLAMTAGSDAHFLWEVGRAGLVVDSLEMSRDSLRDARIFGERTSPMELLRTKINKAFRG